MTSLPVQALVVLRCCVLLIVQMPSSHAVFDLNNHKSGVNRQLRFCKFKKNSEVCLVGSVYIYLSKFQFQLICSYFCNPLWWGLVLLLDSTFGLGKW